MEQDIPERLKSARKKLNLNQVQIALDLDIQQKSISDIENGKIQNIPNKYIYYFYLKGVSLEWIYDGKGEMLKGMNSDISAPQNHVDVADLFSGINKQNELIDETQAGTIISTEAEKQNASIFERLVESKDYNIKSLLAYIKSLENTNEYLKNLLYKFYYDQTKMTVAD